MNYERPAAEGRFEGAFPLAFALRSGATMMYLKAGTASFCFCGALVDHFSVFHLPAPACGGGGSRISPSVMNVSRHVFVYFFSISLAPAETNFVAVAKVQMGKRIRFNLLCGVVCTRAGYLNRCQLGPGEKAGHRARNAAFHMM